MFLDSLPQQVSELRTAVRSGDGPTVQRLAHTLKGAVGTFGARPAFEAGLRLETMARSGDLVQAEPALAALEDALAALQPTLHSWAVR